MFSILAFEKSREFYCTHILLYYNTNNKKKIILKTISSKKNGSLELILRVASTALLNCRVISLKLSND